MSSLKERLRFIIADVAGCEPYSFDADQPLFRGGLELDSLSGAELISSVEREFGIAIADKDLDLESLRSLNSLSRFISQHTDEE